MSGRKHAKASDDNPKGTFIFLHYTFYKESTAEPMVGYLTLS